MKCIEIKHKYHPSLHYKHVASILFSHLAYPLMQITYFTMECIHQGNFIPHPWNRDTTLP